MAAEAIELMTQLLDGWHEKIEYQITAQMHTQECGERLKGLTIHALKHDSCDCPTVIEKRVERRKQDPLLVQLVEAGYYVPQNGSSSGGSASVNKPEAKIPGNLVRPDEILHGCHIVAANHCFQWFGERSSLPDRNARLEADLRTLRSAAAGGTTPHEARPSPPRDTSAQEAARLADLGRDLSKFVNRARLFLGYDSETDAIADTVCGDCGGLLAVARYLTGGRPAAVRCTGTPGTPPCGNSYPWARWIDMLAEGHCFVPTESAVLASGIPRGSLYRLASEGRLRRYGGAGKGRALWSLAEVLSYAEGRSDG